MIRRLIPYFIYKRLFGDRKRYYQKFDKNDKDWQLWIQNIAITYEHRDTGLIDRLLKGNGYKIINNEFVDFNNKDIINVLKTGDDCTHERDNYRDYTNSLDKLWNKNIKDYIPELSSLNQ